MSTIQKLTRVTIPHEYCQKAAGAQTTPAPATRVSFDDVSNCAVSAKDMSTQSSGLRVKHTKKKKKKKTIKQDTEFVPGGAVVRTRPHAALKLSQRTQLRRAHISRGRTLAV
jgi:hypothetical protein